MTTALERVQLAIGDAVVLARPQLSGRVEQVRGLSIQVRGLPARVLQKS